MREMQEKGLEAAARQKRLKVIRDLHRYREHGHPCEHRQRTAAADAADTADGVGVADANI